MATAPTFANAREAAETVRADWGSWPPRTPPRWLLRPRRSACRSSNSQTAMSTAARASILAAFTSGQGYAADADYSPRAWLILILSFGVVQGCDLRRPAVDSVAGGTFAA